MATDNGQELEDNNDYSKLQMGGTGKVTKLSLLLDEDEKFLWKTIREDWQLMVKPINDAAEKHGKSTDLMPDGAFLGWDYKSKKYLFIVSGIDEWYDKLRDDKKYDSDTKILITWSMLKRVVNENIVLSKFVSMQHDCYEIMNCSIITTI